MTQAPARAHPLAHAPDWSEALQRWRKREKLTQRELSRRTGLAVSSVRSYEHGRRHPSQTALLSLIAALGVPREAANPILAAAGYPADLSGLLDKEFVPYTIDELRARADALPWPAYVSNQSFEVVYANRIARLVLDAEVGPAYDPTGRNSFLGGLSHRDIASRVVNWEEVVTFACGLIKGDQEWASRDLAHPPPWLGRPLRRFLQGDPELVRRFGDLWRAAPPVPSRLHHAYNVRWLRRGDRLSFSCRMSLIDFSTNIHWNEWIPADAQTWSILGELSPDG